MPLIFIAPVVVLYSAMWYLQASAKKYSGQPLTETEARVLNQNHADNQDNAYWATRRPCLVIFTGPLYPL